jgi:hypothetical protein
MPLLSDSSESYFAKLPLLLKKSNPVAEKITRSPPMKSSQTAYINPFVFSFPNFIPSFLQPQPEYFSLVCPSPILYPPLSILIIVMLCNHNLNKTSQDSHPSAQGLGYAPYSKPPTRYHQHTKRHPHSRPPRPGQGWHICEGSSFGLHYWHLAPCQAPQYHRRLGRGIVPSPLRL